MRIGVIGAGPAGLTAAYELTKATDDVDVYEASESVGGLARSLQLWGQTVDLGPHRFFSRDRRVNQLWLEVVGRDYQMVNRLTRILYKGRFYQYPLQPWNALANLGPTEAFRCAASYAREKLLSSGNGDSFESWISGRFGRRFYEIFFKSYSEKLWGLPCDELDADFAAQRIKQFSLAAAVKAALSLNGSAQHATLVDQFAYPNGGTGMVYSRMQQAIEERGGRVHLNTPIERVLTDRGRVKAIELAGGELREYDAVISSMPLTLLASRLSEVPESVREHAAQLTFRNTILIFLEVNSDSVCEDNWIYVQDSDILAGRITNFRNWIPQLYGSRRTTILAMEYWCNDNDEIWRRHDEKLITMATNELIASKLVKDPSLITNGFVYRIRRCYPVYRRGYQKVLKPIRDYLRTVQGLQVIGRYGAFKYNNQDHSILMGLLSAENALECAQHDLWSVNCDYDTYQESCRITETGLVSSH